MVEFNHISVLKNELIDSLKCEGSEKLFIDATLGAGGHSELILQKISKKGHLISFDVDNEAIDYASNRLKCYENLTIIKDNYINVKKNLHKLGYKKISGGIIFDFGASYHQLTSKDRGFSFKKDSNLDMRFNMEQEKTAYDIVNGYREDKLVKIFSQYGEERFSKRIAKKIIEVRQRNKIKTTSELTKLIDDATPNIKSRIHSATRIFQALRIETNEELKNIKKVLYDIVPILEIGAIISAISFHSLEDRLVKRAFKEMSIDSKTGVVVIEDENYGKKLLNIITKKPIVPNENEIKINPASRSAKMRTAIRV